MPALVLLRHGQSLWNQEGRFTGWMDIDLSEKGRSEAREAGRIMHSLDMSFDVAFTSVLRRAIRTLWIALDEMDLMWIRVQPSWRLNERFYGDLQGRSKKEVEDIYGPAQVHRWRRGFRDTPPPLQKSDPRYPLHDPRYAGLDEQQLPTAESLLDTYNRVAPFWHGQIKCELQAGRRVFVVSHGNTLRALVKLLEGLSDEEIEGVEIPTGVPLVWELDRDLVPISHRFLHSSSAVGRGKV